MGHDVSVHQHLGNGTLETLLPVLALSAAVGAYLLLAHRARRRNPVLGWSPWRTASLLTGAVLLAAALLPPVAALAHDDFRAHMIQHLLIGMYSPLTLVLAAPVTLLLRTLSAPRARRLTGLLRSTPARFVARPEVALTLSVGSLVPLYFTPLYNAIAGVPAAHWLLHAHFFLSGCLFTHAIAGPDPAPSRPGVRARLVCLGVAVAMHAVVSQLMYGGFRVHIHAPIDQVRGGAEIMYYGGDGAELLLAAALVTTWRPDRRRTAPPRVAGTGAAPTPV
ncbi:cytochrome c oxidase assembly protein [Streptomyces sp. NPDC002164]|uniref:cytochrome c oxidase assembly protein n=1 Tax=Streptomyces sp. NPDC002164 TaxID=3364633 RepID=UPI003682F404